MENDFIVEDVMRPNLKIAMFISGIVAILFATLFVVIGICFNNIAIAVIGGGFTIASTAITHVVFGYDINSDNLPDYVVQINNDTEMNEFQKKYKILEDLGHGLYRVSLKKDQETRNKN